WLFVNVGMTAVVVAFETGGCRFATQNAVDAFIVDVEFFRYVFWVFFFDVGPSFFGKSGIQHFQKKHSAQLNRACAQPWWNVPGAWSASSPTIRQLKSV